MTFCQLAFKSKNQGPLVAVCLLTVCLWRRGIPQKEEIAKYIQELKSKLLFELPAR